MTESQITWEDPPEGSLRKGMYDWFFDQLRANPGKWAVFKESSTRATATQIRGGHYVGTSEGEFDTRTTTLPNPDRVKIYVRYIPRDEQ